MYEKRARGHATACINGLQEYSRVRDWGYGPRAAKATSVFSRSSFAKKPGRVLKRLSPLLHPCFGEVTIRKWSRHEKMILATGLSSSTENLIYRLPEDSRPLYSERAVFLTDVAFLQRYDDIRLGSATKASISHHAIARLMERGASAPDDLWDDLHLILGYCGGLAQSTRNAMIAQTHMQSFLLPFKDGALVAVFMEMEPAQAFKGEERGRVLSVRTWLDADKLSDMDHERMGGLDAVMQALVMDPDIGLPALERWTRANARPWQFADSTLDGKTR